MATMKKSLKARIAAGFGAAAVATAAVLGGALPASAAPDSNIDTTIPGELTIHKYTEHVAPTGERGNGLAADAADLAGLTALRGVGFTATFVPGADLATPGGWALAAELQKATDPVHAARAIIGANAANYTGSTNADGEIRWTGMPLGVYLVEETTAGTNNIVQQADPFLVSVPMANPLGEGWLHSVHVYPKNSTTAITKTVDHSTAYGLGDKVTWSIKVDVPEVANGDVLRKFVITDVIDPRLTLVTEDSAMTLTSVDPAGDRVNRPLNGGHISITLVDGVYTLTFSESGRALLASLNDAELVIDAVTTVTAVGDGIIKNTAKLQANDLTVTTSAAQTQWGSLDILKHVTGNRDAVLSGAKFQIFNSKDDAADPANAISVNGVSEFETGANGIAPVAGLRVGTYWLVETQAPIGYEPLEDGLEFTIKPGANAEAIGNSQIPAYALPVTGGTGQAAFMIGGFGLLAGALGFMLIRRRKAQADA